MTRRPHAALLPGGRLHLQDGPIDLVIGAFGEAAAVRAAQEAAVRRFDGLLDELCAELSLLRTPVGTGGTPPAGPVARRMYAAVAAVAGVRGGGDAEDGAAFPVSRQGWEKSLPRTCSGVPEGRMRARAERGVPKRGSAASMGAAPRGLAARPSSGASRHLLPPSAGEGEDAAAPLFITPMAAVAGAVADAVLAAMLADAPLARAYVNNGGDIALFLAPGETFAIGMVDRPDRPGVDASALFGRTVLSAADGIGGIATSGWRGRSFSLGIADAVTVLARDAAAADAAATVVANAVDLPGHPAVTRAPANALQPDSDLGDRLVTRGLGPLAAAEIAAALAAGAAVAEDLQQRGLVAGAALHLAGATRVVGDRLALSAQREGDEER